jgi:hypothetical protein
MVRLLIFTAGLWGALSVCTPAQEVSNRDQPRPLARPERVLLHEELRGNCAGLTVTIKLHIERLRKLKLQAEQEEKELEPSLFDERPAVVELGREQDRVEALNVVLDAKGCKPVNVGDELRTLPAATQMVRELAPSPHKAMVR